MTSKKQKYFTSANKKFYQNNPGSYFDYMMNNINDVVESVSTTNQPEEFEAVVVSGKTEKIRQLELGTDKNYRSYKIRFIDNTYGTDTTAMPDPLEVGITLTQYQNRVQYHPDAIFMIDAEDPTCDFGYTVTVKLIESTWVIQRVILKSNKVYADFIKKLTEQESKASKGGYKPDESDFSSKVGETYDEIEDKQFVDKKIQHTSHFNTMSDEFLVVIKMFIAELWNQKRYLTHINDGGRTYKDYERLLKTHNEKKAERVKEMKAGVAKEDQTKVPAKPSKTSYHFIGSAMDFNPQNDKGKTIAFMRDNKEAWIKTGVPAIAESMGLVWGGSFSNNYDPVHVDFGKYLVSSTTLPDDYAEWKKEREEQEYSTALPAYYLQKAKEGTVTNLYKVDAIEMKDVEKYYNNTALGKERKNTTKNMLGEGVSYDSDTQQATAQGEEVVGEIEEQTIYIDPEDYAPEQKEDFLAAGGNEEAWQDYENMLANEGIYDE